MNPETQRVAYQQSADTAEQSRRCLLAAFARFGVPTRMLDVGCGPGHLVRTAAALGAYAMGLDLNVAQVSTSLHGDGIYDLLTADLTIAQGFLEPFDLVLCLEVAEHLPASAAATLCETVARAVAPGGVVLFSAATPGQGGSGHLNEQPNIYWLERLAAPTVGQLSGLVWDQQSTSELREDWTAAAPVAWWYGKNLLMFRKQEAGNE